jgi:hypothetical protein
LLDLVEDVIFITSFFENATCRFRMSSLIRRLDVKVGGDIDNLEARDYSEGRNFGTLFSTDFNRGLISGTLTHV